MDQNLTSQLCYPRAEINEQQSHLYSLALKIAIFSSIPTVSFPFLAKAHKESLRSFLQFICMKYQACYGFLQFGLQVFLTFSDLLVESTVYFETEQFKMVLLLIAVHGTLLLYYIYQLADFIEFESKYVNQLRLVFEQTFSFVMQFLIYKMQQEFFYLSYRRKYPDVESYQLALQVESDIEQVFVCPLAIAMSLLTLVKIGEIAGYDYSQYEPPSWNNGLTIRYRFE